MSNSEGKIEIKHINKISNELKNEEKEKENQNTDELTDVDKINDAVKIKKNKTKTDNAANDAVISPSGKSDTKGEENEISGDSTAAGVKPEIRGKTDSKSTTCVERDKSDKTHELPIPQKAKEGESPKGKENGQLKLNDNKNKKENDGNESNSGLKDIKDNKKSARKQVDEAENKDGKKLSNWVAGLPPGAIRNLGTAGLKGQSLPLFLSMPSGGTGGLSLLSAGLPPGRYVILPSTTSSIPSISNISPSMSSLTLGKSSIVAQISNKSISLVQGSSSAVTTTTAAVTSLSPSVIHPIATTSSTITTTAATEKTHAPTGRNSAPAGRSFRGRRKSYTTAEKLAMIEAVESGQKKSNVADQFGVAPSTLACILLQKNKIRCDQIKIDMSRRRIRRTRTLPIVPGPAGKHLLSSGRGDPDRAGDNPFVHFLSPLSPPRPTIFEESPEEIFSMPDLSERMGMENEPSPGKLEGSSSYLTCSPIISTMSGLHDDMMTGGAGPSSSCQESSENDVMSQDYDQDDIDVKTEPMFNVEPEICEDESQNNTQSSCDRRSSQSSPAPGMAGPYLLKKETHCATILDQLLRDDTFCDVTLTAEGQSMRAHKIVLCLASAYFRQVLSKEANVQNVIVFRDIKFAELKNLINFIYTGEATVDAAELESFMKTAEMLEVTSLCDGQRKIPKNLIPKSRDTESERTRVNVPSKRALNPSSTPPPSKSRKVDDSFKTGKSVAQASTSGGTTHPSSVIHHQTPPVYLHSPPVIKSEPANEDENPPEEDFRTFESLTQSPGYHQGADATQSIDNDTGPPVHKAPVGGCPFCPSSDQILTGVTLTQHLSTTHPDKTVFPCHTCLRVFLKKGPYDAHIENCNR